MFFDRDIELREWERVAKRDLTRWCALALLALACLWAWGLAFSADVPDELNQKTCQEMVIREGVGLARLRWGRGITLEQWMAVPFAPGLPQWYMDLLEAWFTDACSWAGDPDAWVNHLLEQCRGMTGT